MTATNLIQIIATALGVIGSLFFTIGIVRQSPATMAALAGSFFDFNPHTIPALAAQKADYVFGGLFIVFAFLAQLMASLAPQSSTIAIGPRSATLIALAATPVVFAALYRASRLLASRYEWQIREAAEKAVAKSVAEYAASRGAESRR